MLVRGSDVSDIAQVFGVSQVFELQHLWQLSKQVSQKAEKQKYDRLQIDELWSFVGKKNRKQWFLYAYCPESKEIAAIVCGSISASTVKSFTKRLKTCW